MLDYEGIHLSIEHLGTAGIVLTPEQKSAFQTSLVVLKQQNAFHRLYMWGKILGITDDYFIAVGLGKNEFAEKRILYTRVREDKDGLIKWKVLNPPTEEARDKNKFITGRFMGDPSHEYEYAHVTKTGEGDDIQEEETIITLKEEERLAVVVETINESSVIVPRGAFTRTPTNIVTANRTWEGLTVAESAKLCNYFHFREAKIIRNPVERASLDKAIDFMDSIEEDCPKGVWSLQFDRGSALVLLKNLEWLGYTFFHVPCSRNYGSLYVGTGERNMDLPFML